MTYIRYFIVYIYIHIYIYESSLPTFASKLWKLHLSNNISKRTPLPMIKFVKINHKSPWLLWLMTAGFLFLWFVRASMQSIAVMLQSCIQENCCSHVRFEVFITFLLARPFGEHAACFIPNDLLRDDVMILKRFPHYWSLWRESFGHRWISLTEGQ